MRPWVKLTSSRICNISSQPALRRAGVMNFVQMSRSERPRLSIGLSGLPFRFASLPFLRFRACKCVGRLQPIVFLDREHHDNRASLLGCRDGGGR